MNNCYSGVYSMIQRVARAAEQPGLIFESRLGKGFSAEPTGSVPGGPSGGFIQIEVTDEPPVVESGTGRSIGKSGATRSGCQPH